MRPGVRWVPAAIRSVKYLGKMVPEFTYGNPFEVIARRMRAVDELLTDCVLGDGTEILGDTIYSSQLAFAGKSTEWPGLYG